MKKKKLAFILKYCSPNQIFFVDQNYRLNTRICPFDVLVMREVGDFKKTQVVKVEMVKATENLTTVFVIEGQAYHYYYFEIV